MAITLRRGTPADADVIVAFNRELARESEDMVLDDARIVPGVAAVLADPAKGFYTVAEVGGEVVGQTMITFEWSDWRNGWFWWVQSVYVRPEFRRSGVFSALFRHLKAEAAATPGVIGLRLYAEADNARARATYTRLGMTVTTYGVFELFPLD